MINFLTVKDISPFVSIVRDTATNKKYIFKSKNSDEYSIYRDIQEKHGKTMNLIFFYGEFEINNKAGGLFEYIENAHRSSEFFDNVNNGINIGKYALRRLIRDTFSGLCIIHTSGYLHTDLGQFYNIITEGPTYDFGRALIIDIEGQTYTNIKQTTDEVWTLAMILWHFIDGESAGQYDEVTRQAYNNNTTNENLLNYYNYVLEKSATYPEYSEEIQVLLYALSLERPTTNQVLRKLNDLTGY